MSRSRYIFAILGTAALSLAPVSLVLSTIGFEAAFAKNGGNGGGNGNGGEKGGDKGGARDKAGSGKTGGAENGASSKADKSAANSAAKTAKAGTVGSAPATAKGKLASELKGLNAAHASASAFANASDNSRVGRIRAYRDAYGAEALAAADAEVAAAELARLAGLTPEEIAAEFADPVGYDRTGYDTALADAEAAGDVAAAEALRALTPEERAAAYPSGWDADAAYAESLATATEVQTKAAAAAAAAGALTEAALATAGGADLSPEALDYLHELLGLEDADATAAVN